MCGIARFTPEELTQMRIDDAKLEKPHKCHNKKHKGNSTTKSKSELNKEYYRSHRYEICEYAKEYRQTHKSELAEANKKWRNERPNYMKKSAKKKKAATRRQSDSGAQEIA